MSAEQLLTMDTVSCAALEQLLDDATDVSVHKETYERVESILHKIRDATQHLTNLMAKVTNGPVTNQPCLSEARKLYKIVSELPVKTAEIVKFTKLVNRAEDWVKRAKRAFGKQNSSIPQFEDHLIYVLERNKKVFDTADVPKLERSLSPNLAEDVKESEDGPYCICRSGPTGEMVECDKCKEWYLFPG